MKKIILLVILLSFLSPTYSFAENEYGLKAVFLRGGNVWIINKNKEKQITDSGKIFSRPKWSQDGEWILYQEEAPSEFQPKEQQVEVWAYKIETGEKKKIFYDGYSPKWAPTKKVIAFNAKGILNISDFKRFYNMATGVNDYTWFPDGSGFLLSSSGTLRPDGWTSAILFTKKIKPDYSDIILFGGVDHFFTLPREVGTTNQNKLIAVHAENFQYSPSNKWISFTVSPTASWSMDSNMLCVISSDGENFEVLDEIVFEVGSPKWAPTTDTLAFIAGGGRIVFGFKNKDLKVREMPVSGTFTPQNFADVDFNWITDYSLVTSRIEEKEWSNDFSEHPLPSLFTIDISNNKQTKITNPPEGYGDYHPQYVESIKKIVWQRGKTITDRKRTLWKSNIDGSQAEEWLKNIELIEFY